MSGPCCSTRSHAADKKENSPRQAGGAGGGGLPRTERQPAGLIARPAGQGRAVRPAHTPQIKKELPQTSWGSFFFMPVVGVEPTRVISTRDFESPSSAIPTHRRVVLNVFYYTGFPGQNQEKVCVFFQIVPHGVKYMTPVLARRRRLCYTKVRSKRK